MPRIQSLTAGVEGWTSLPDLRPDIALTCARGTHRVQMPENILGALFHLSKPYSRVVLDQRERRWVKRVSEPLAGKTLGILGLGEIGRELAEKAAALELRVHGGSCQSIVQKADSHAGDAESSARVGKLETHIRRDRKTWWRITCFVLQ